jgi:hypothetical protein
MPPRFISSAHGDASPARPDFSECSALQAGCTRVARLVFAAKIACCEAEQAAVDDAGCESARTSSSLRPTARPRRVVNGASQQCRSYGRFAYAFTYAIS